MEVLTRKSKKRKFNSCIVDGDNIQKKLLNLLFTVEQEFGDFKNIIFYQIPETNIRQPLVAHQTNTFGEIAQLVKTKTFNRFYFIKYKSKKAAAKDMDSVQHFVSSNNWWNKYQ